MNKRLVILESVAGPLYWVILGASIWVLLRGHNEPGGGFIGGLVAVSASILWAVAKGSDAASRRMPLGSPLVLTSVGLGLGTLAGIPAFFYGDAFLTHLWGSIPLGFTDFKVSTVLLFDIGVYLCVWGALAGYALALLSVGESHNPDDAAQEGQP